MRTALGLLLGALLVAMPASGQNRVRELELNGGLSVEAYRGNLAAATASVVDSTDRAYAAIGEVGARGTVALLEAERRWLFLNFDAGLRQFAAGGFAVRDYAPRDVQRRAFARQLELAAASGKPLFLHQRDAHEDFLALLREQGSRLPGGVAHCFTNGPAEVADYLSIGLYIGITGWICDERRASELRAAVACIPLDRIVVETDSPYLLPRSLRPLPRSRRNEPATLPEVVQTLAGFMGHSPEAVAEATTRNAETLFGLSSGPR